MKKSKLVIKIGILIVVIIALIGLMLWGIKSDNGFTFFEQSVLIYNNAFEEIESINVDITSYDVKIEESNDNTVQVEISGSEKHKNKFSVEQKNKELVINQNNSDICIGFCLDGSITIYLPKQEIAYTHKSSSGNLNSEIDLGNININTISGDIVLKNINKGSISSTSGNITIANANKLNVNSSSGDILLDTVLETNISSQSGNVKIKNITDQMNITTTSGDIDILSLSIEKDSIVEARSGNVNINLNKKVFIDVATRSGNIDIDNTNTNPTLKITTISGDITAK